MPLIGRAAGGICFNQSEVLKCILRRKSTTHSFCYKIFRAQRGKLNFRITGTQGENKDGGPYVLLQFINVLYVLSLKKVWVVNHFKGISLMPQGTSL